MVTKYFGWSDAIVREHVVLASDHARIVAEKDARIESLMRQLGERDGKFLDKNWCCKVCDGEIPDGHTDNCDIWKLEKKLKDFIAGEHNAVLIERDALKAQLTDAVETSREMASMSDSRTTKSIACNLVIFRGAP